MIDQPLSPSAQAVFTAILNLKDNINPRHRIAAAALRAAADQVLIRPGIPSGEYSLLMRMIDGQLRAIAAELEAQQ